MTRARIAAVAVLAPALIVTGCTSSGHKNPALSISSGTAASGAAGVAAQLRAGIDGLTSASIKVDASAVLDALDGQLALKSGEVTASKLLVGSGNTAATVITIGTTSYAKLPAGQNTSGTTWAKVSLQSTNEFVRGLAGSLSIVQEATDLNGIATLVSTGTEEKSLGAATVNGVATTHYSLVVHGDANGKGLSPLLAVVGASGVPTDLWLDASGRPIEVTFSITTPKVTATVTLGNFNAPASISAPPKNDILEN
jgi:hypothetical protein